MPLVPYLALIIFHQSQFSRLWAVIALILRLI
ncbi:hypothetical protein PROP_03574 [Propionicimonas sp. T2.31MG-18]